MLDSCSCTIQEEKPHLCRFSSLAKKNLIKSEADAVINIVQLAWSEEEADFLDGQ